ncbi:MAG TPA: FAD-dependent oxidoreductase [Gemmatimonadales bacterium]|nr:FAD-dependent oxidoreductase [Gemmatimonadales bacterium]
MRTASIVIIGGGVIGASVAYHLARRGWREILVLDRSSGPGLGSTGRATGGFRAQYATPINVRLSLLSREKLRCFREETGGEAGYHPAGYLWLASTAGELEVLRSARRVQHQEGLTEAVEVGPKEIARLNPAVDLDEVIGGAFCPSDGFIRPLGIVEGYLAAAQRLGVKLEWQVEVTGLTRRADDGVALVETSSGPVSPEAVVNAAGPWAAQVAQWAGFDLPVAPLRRQVAATAPSDLLPENMPMTIFTSDGFHLRVRDGRILLLWPTPGVPGRPFDTAVDDEWIHAVAAKAHRRIPVVRRAAIDRDACWAGLYEVSPDKHAILGAAPDCPNLFLANGCSGHGVMHAPALGQLLAEVMSDRAASTMDVSSLRPSRFREGKPNPVSELL